MTKLEKIVEDMIEYCHDTDMGCRDCAHDQICELLKENPCGYDKEQILKELNS